MSHCWWCDLAPKLRALLLYLTLLLPTSLCPLLQIVCVLGSYCSLPNTLVSLCIVDRNHMKVSLLWSFLFGWFAKSKAMAVGTERRKFRLLVWLVGFVLFVLWFLH